MESYDDLFKLTLINVMSNWSLIQQDEKIMNGLRNNKLCTQLKSDPLIDEQLIQANVLTYQLICMYLLSLPDMLNHEFFA